MKKLLLALWPLAATAQTTPDPRPPAAGWGVGVGVGNGLELHGGYYGRRWLAFGRLRGKWWGPESGPQAQLFGDDLNTRSRQTEVAALLGYPLALGRSIVYGAAGIAYLSGRELGQYRYTLREGGFFTSDATHYYSYRDYRALGLPVEVGYQLLVPNSRPLYVGVVGQANFNPQQHVYCVLLALRVAVVRQP